jgi:hypothetical protein
MNPIINLSFFRLCYDLPMRAMLIMLAMTTVARAQVSGAADKPAFEVASVKRHPATEPVQGLRRQPGGGLTAIGVPLRQLLDFAYNVRDHQVVGAPSWSDSERYDLIAKAAEVAGNRRSQAADRG